ncbi:MAG: hypothetical protein M3P45_16300 [Acidobacteriota bacterium]|nr:hypothetical protein [Acidobacteriota bacterium]
MCVLGVFLNALISNVEFNGLHMYLYITNLAAMMIVTVWNYQTNWLLNWTVSGQE